MDLEKIQAHRDEQSALSEYYGRQEDSAFALKSVLDSQGNIEKTVRESILSLARVIVKHEPKVEITNQKDVPSYDPVIEAITKLVDVILASNKNLEKIEAEQFDYSPIVEAVNDLARIVDEIPKTNPEPLRAIEVTNQIDPTRGLREIREAIESIPETVVNVPEFSLEDAPETLKKILGRLNKLEFPPIPKTDIDPLIKATDNVARAVNSLVFPVANYILPYRDTSGKATQVQLDASGKVPISGSITSVEANGDLKYGITTSLAMATSATLVTYTAIANDVIKGFVATGTRSGYFFLQINAVTKLSGRIAPGYETLNLNISVGKLLTVGDTITLRVTNEGQGVADFEGSAIIQNG